jgi:tetratricopeptide (TPR) repeat protein
MPPRQPFRQNAPNPAARPLAKAIEHHKAGRSAEAEKQYRVALALAPRNGDALRSLGALYLQAGKPEQALPLLQAALQVEPNNAEILNNLGVALSKAGRREEAAAHFRQALEIKPAYGEALVNLGSALQSKKNFEEAVVCFERALRLRPDDPETLYCLGSALYEQGKPEAALAYYAKATQIRPSDAKTQLNMGVCWQDLNNLQEAVLCYEKALRSKPDYVHALVNLSAALWGMERGAEARAKLERALQIEPDNAGAITKLGSLLNDEGKIGEALEHFNRALAHAPENEVALGGKSLALLALGEYREGWKFYEIGLGHSNMRGVNRFSAVKMWDGKPAPDKHLLIWTEQGIGDSLQFIRYAELCKLRFRKVSVLCQKPLVRLFKALPFIDDVFDVPQEGRNNFDEQVAIMSLPHRFDTVLETVPATVPYLRVDPAIQAKWTAKFASVTGMKIGLVWAGGSHKDNKRGNLMDRQRSVGLERMKPWLDLQGARFYNLQKDEPGEQIKALGLADRLTDFMDEVTDFADTAAIVQNLDLVITVDTSVAHLAGGLGKPVWILSRYNADWRWLQNRPTNPWYPTARIFGQPTLGDWDSVMAEVGRELALEIAKKSAPITTQFSLNPFRSH